MTKVYEVPCLLCGGENKALGQQIGVENYHMTTYDGAKINTHMLSCGHYASVFFEGKMTNPATYLPYRKGDTVIFYENVNGLRHNSFISIIENANLKYFQPVFDLEYESIQLADGLTPETATGKFFLPGLREPYSSAPQE